MTKGVIYVLTNPSFPEYVKIGYADDLEKRLRQLNNSECLPFAFRVYCIYEVEERLKDKDVHLLIDKLNPSLRAIDSFDGKTRIKEFYNMNPEDAYEILLSIAKVSNTVDRLKRMKPEGHEILDEKIALDNQSKEIYSEEKHFQKGNELIQKFYFDLKERILQLGNIRIEPTKLYVAYKSSFNICDIEFTRQRLRLTINMVYKDVDDPSGLTIDLTGKGHWGNGDVRIDLFGDENLDDVMYIIKQSYKKNK